jgi:hypothetical protein
MATRKDVPRCGREQGISVDDLAVLELKGAVSDRQPVSLDTGTNTITQVDGAGMTELGYGRFKDNTKTLPLPKAPEQTIWSTQSSAVGNCSWARR